MTNQDREKRLIEVGMPLEKISEESRREKNINHGNPSTMHVWWARRPLSSSRTTAYASLVNHPDNDEERDNEISFIERLSEWEAVTDRDVLERARSKIEEEQEGTPRILDPFAGGGAIPLEAQRIGCESHSLDFSPIAYILNKAVMEFPYKFGPDQSENSDELVDDRNNLDDKLVEDIIKWGSWVQEEVKDEIGQYFGENEIGYIWARTIPCTNPNCELEIPLIRRFWLNSKRPPETLYTLEATTDGEIDIQVLQESEYEEVEDGIKVEETGKTFDPSDGTVRRGSVSCPACGNGFKANKTKELAEDIGWGNKLLVIIEQTKNGKSYRTPAQEDIDRFEDSKEELDEVGEKWIPSEEIPLHDNTSRYLTPRTYGHETWADLFNPRQKLALIRYCQKTNKLYDNLKEEEGEEYAKAIATYIALGVDKIPDYNCNLTSWSHSNEAIRHVFTRGALSMGWDYVESNPISGSSGSLTSALEWIERVVEKCSYLAGEPEVNLGDATSLPYEENHFDAVFTDPPYYDNIPYAALSDFFYVWLKRSIGDLYPEAFSTPLSPKSGEIIQDQARHESEEDAEEFFESKLSDSFSEIHRVLKEDGICTIVFAHKSSEAWAQLIRSLLSSDLVVTATWPIHTERHNRPRGMESAALSSSVYFICRKQSGSEIGYYSDVQEELRDRVHRKLDYFWDQGIRGADLLVSAIGPATEIFGQYETVKRLSGDEVTVDELLEETQRLVSEYALEKVLEEDVDLGAIDPETRFYILFRWAFANQKEDYDEVRKLAQVNNANVDQLERVGILDVTRGDASLQPPQRRSIDEPEKVPESNNLLLVEKIHRAAVLWESGNRDKLKSFVEEHCMSEEFWRSAQAISECLPEGESESEKEKQMLHGLLSYGGQTDFEGSGQSTLGTYTDGGEDQ